MANVKTTTTKLPAAALATLPGNITALLTAAGYTAGQHYHVGTAAALATKAGQSVPNTVPAAWANLVCLVTSPPLAPCLVLYLGRGLAPTRWALRPKRVPGCQTMRRCWPGTSMRKALAKRGTVASPATLIMPRLPRCAYYKPLPR